MSLKLNEQVTFRVVFRDWDASGGGFGDPIDPQSVVFNIYLRDDPVFVPHFTDDPVREGVGIYSYTWIPTDPGVYKIEFEGIFPDDSVTVIDSIIAVSVDVDYDSLGIVFESTFLSNIFPIYVDPETIQMFFPDASLIHITELIYKYSKEVDAIMKGKEPSFKALEYIEAVVLCALSRMFDFALYGSGAANSIQLGDLRVSNEQGFTRGSRVANRGNAMDFCELAYALRLELMRGEAGIKAVRTGSNFKNPMPKRKLKHGWQSWDKSKSGRYGR